MERAKQEGIKAKIIIVDDDAALPITKGITGGRGLAGTLFVHKVAGALSSDASAEYDLEHIHSYLSENVVHYTRTLGVALTTCTIPGTPASDRLAAADAYEVGLGIHGEPGREKCVLPKSDIAKSIASTLVNGILDITEPPPSPLPEPEQEIVETGDVTTDGMIEVNAGELVLPLSELSITEPLTELCTVEENNTDAAVLPPHSQVEATDMNEQTPIEPESEIEPASDSKPVIIEHETVTEIQSTPRKQPESVVAQETDVQSLSTLAPTSVSAFESPLTIVPPFATPLKRTSSLPYTTTTVKTPSSALYTPSKRGSFRFNFAEPIIERRPQRMPVTGGEGDELVLIINNLGSLPIIEMYVLAKEILLEMRRRRLNVVRVYIGHFMTSLDMSGCSLSVLKVSSLDTLELLDSETTAPAWVKSLPLDLLNSDDVLTASTLPYNEADYQNARSETILSQSKVESSCAVALILTKQICLKLIEMEPVLTKYDQICGDGDCGLVMKAGASRILADIYSIDVNAQEFNLVAALKTISNALLPEEQVTTPMTPSSKTYKACGHNPALLFDRIATCISESMGGTSGILLEICFRTMSTYILGLDSADVSERLWIDALDRGVTAIQNYGGELFKCVIIIIRVEI